MVITVSLGRYSPGQGLARSKFLAILEVDCHAGSRRAAIHPPIIIVSNTTHLDLAVFRPG